MVLVRCSTENRSSNKPFIKARVIVIFGEFSNTSRKPLYNLPILIFQIHNDNPVLEQRGQRRRNGFSCGGRCQPLPRQKLLRDPERKMQGGKLADKTKERNCSHVVQSSPRA